MSTKFFLLLLFTLCLIGTDPVRAQPSQRQGEEQFLPRSHEGREPRFRRGLRGEGMQQRREQQRRRLAHARNMAQRLLEDAHTPEDIKAKARRLEELLAKRERLEREVEGKRQDFLRTHRQDVEELRRLREQGEPHRRNLRAAREKARAEHQPLIQEMRRTTQEAREIAREIRSQYQGQRGGKSEE
ncbi:MAG: hypothetical protein ACRERD_19740 [Candidatus Binatia bacterium]